MAVGVAESSYTMDPPLSLPDPIGAAPTEDPLLLNLSPTEVTKLEVAPALGRHRRCSSDTFYSLQAHLAVPDIELLGESSAPHRRPTVDSVQQDEILRFLRDPPHAPDPAGGPGHQGGPQAGVGVGAGAGAGSSTGYEGAPSPSLSPSAAAAMSEFAAMRSAHLRRSNTISVGMITSTSEVASALGFGEEEELDEDEAGAAGGAKGKGKAKAGTSKKRKRSKDDAEPDTMPRVRGLSLVDEKKAKRILANRISAQKSRLRKLEFISSLETSVGNLKAEIEALQKRVDLAQQQKGELQKINAGLKEELSKLKHISDVAKNGDEKADGAGRTIFRDSL